MIAELREQRTKEAFRFAREKDDDLLPNFLPGRRH